MSFFIDFFRVGTVRLELTWISPPPPQDGASAISPCPLGFVSVAKQR